MRLQWLRPPQPFLGMLLQRAAVLWLLGRMTIAFYAAMFEGFPALTEVLCLGPANSLALTSMVAGLTLLDVHRRHESILLANLGCSGAGIFVLAALPSLVLEALTCLLPT